MVKETFVENEKLMNSINIYKRSKDKNMFIDTLEEVVKSNFLMPMKVSVKSNEKLSQLINGNYSSLKESDWMKKEALHLEASVNGKECELLCLFTSYEKAKEYMDGCNGIEVLHFKSAYENFANINSSKFGGVIINPYSDNFIVTNGYARIAVA